MDQVKLRDETEPSPKVDIGRDFDEQGKMDTESPAVNHSEQEKFVTDWFIE